MAFCEAVDAGDAVLHLEDGADLFDVELVEVGGFDLAKEDVLDLAGAERGVGCHTVGREKRATEVRRGWPIACENYHKARSRQASCLTARRSRAQCATRREDPVPTPRRDADLAAMASGVRELRVWQEAVALAGEVVRAARQGARRETKALSRRS